ncbi:putative reverse transcriptase domain-containing protein [Tanacetum coccineum]|uniref:Reverse transcriptase domain-containing protein n=1 Tax=Tanacetum coccineum TaxID=301880 RepID=A0ABQ5C1Y5_9ASTR
MVGEMACHESEYLQTIGSLIGCQSNDPQCELLLIRRLTHSFDMALRSALAYCHAPGLGLANGNWRHRYSPLTFGGLAFYSASATLQTTKLLRDVGIVAPGSTFDDALCVFNNVMEIDFLSNLSEIALWQAQSEDHTFRLDKRLRVGFMLGIFIGDHVVSCAGIIGIKHRHNMVRDTLVDICFRSGISAGKEVDIGLEEGHDKKLRPADMLLYSWDGGLDVCVDLTGSSPLTQTRMSDFAPGRAVTDAAHRKRGKYMAKCADIGYGFLPFSFSSLGELETDAVTLLKRVRNFSMAQDIGARAAGHIFNRIGFSIAKGVGAQIVSRLPSNVLELEKIDDVFGIINLSFAKNVTQEDVFMNSLRVDNYHLNGMVVDDTVRIDENQDVNHMEVDSFVRLKESQDEVNHRVVEDSVRIKQSYGDVASTNRMSDDNYDANYVHEGSGEEEDKQPTSSKQQQQQQQQDYDAWVEIPEIDEDEVITKDETPELLNEFQNVDKRERRQEDLITPKKDTLVLYGPQRNPNKPPRYLYNKDLFYLKHGNTKEKKYVLSLHNIHATSFLENDLEDKLTRWVQRIENEAKTVQGSGLAGLAGLKAVNDELGIESYQMKVNLIAPTLTIPSIDELNPLSIIDVPFVVLKEVKLKIFEFEYKMKNPVLGDLDLKIMKAFERETEKRLKHYDILLTTSSTIFLQRIIASLYKEISMTDLGSLISFMGISVNGTMKGMFLFHKKYVVKVLERVVQQVFLYMHDILEPHLAVLKRILCYVCGTLDYDYCVFLGNNLLSWSFKRQYTFSRSTVEAENCGVANAMHETSWLQKILRELHSPLHYGTVVYCDKLSSVYLSSSPMQHQRTKHIEIDIHFVQDWVATG